jgi:peroxiredoxin
MTSNPLAVLRDVFAYCRDADESLAERLDTYSLAVRNLIPAYAEAIDRLVARLKSTGAGSVAPRAGEPMPPFILPDEQGHLTSLSELCEHGPVAVTFHRGHWCPWCRISIAALARVQRQISETGGQVTAIMPDRQRFAAEFKREASAPFRILTDMDNGYALSLGLAFWLGPDLERLLSSYGRLLPDYQGNESWILPIPATFVVDRDGLVRASFIDPDFRQRMTVQGLIEALEAATR